jgi:phage terminase large subunit GpA-like protein
MHENDREFFLEQAALLPDNRPPRLISEYVEGRRVLPTNTPFPGAWRNARAPYLVEIQDSLSPYNPTQVVVVKKCRKVGLTTAMDNCVAYYMDALPSPILYTTASDTLARDWAATHIDPVIDSLGFRHKITAARSNTKSKRSGDTAERKEYVGGELHIMSSLSKEALRQLDKRVLFIDEVDGVEKLLSSGEGKWVEVLWGHTFSWGARKKIAMFSSPTTDEESLIKEYHAKGDQRVFLIPCPYCGELIELKLLLPAGTPYGLHADTKAGKVVQVYYTCENCGEPIYDHQKRDFYSPHPSCLKYPKKEVPPARWKPTAKPADPYWRSYGMNALYSPLGMLSFTNVYKKQAEVENSGDPEEQRSFINLYGGMEYKATGSRPRLAAVLGHRGAYPRGTVPPGVLFLTAAVDVQEGSPNDLSHPERLEIMVMGHGKGYRSWVIDYRVFEGSTENPYGGAWEELYQWLLKINGTFYSARHPAGTCIPYRIVALFVDSGDASRTRAGVSRSDVVYRYCERHSPIAFPIKGFARLSRRRGESPDIDIPGAASFKKYRTAKIGSGDEVVVEISTAYYKDTLFGRLKIERSPRNPSPNGYFAVFADAADDFFVQLTNSEKLGDNSFRDIGDHEVMDTAIYCLAAADAFLAGQVRLFKDKRRAAGMDHVTVEMATSSRDVLDWLEKQIAAFGARPAP